MATFLERIRDLRVETRNRTVELVSVATPALTLCLRLLSVPLLYGQNSMNPGDCILLKTLYSEVSNTNYSKRSLPQENTFLSETKLLSMPPLTFGTNISTSRTDRLTPPPELWRVGTHRDKQFNETILRIIYVCISNSGRTIAPKERTDEASINSSATDAYRFNFEKKIRETWIARIPRSHSSR